MIMKRKIVWVVSATFMLNVAAFIWITHPRSHEGLLEVQVQTSETAEGVSKTRIEVDSISLSLAELSAHATHIVEAEYMGTEKSAWSSGPEHIYRPTQSLKGDISSDNLSLIHVAPSPDIETETAYRHIEGEHYILFLEKNSSVYYDHDIYVMLTAPESNGVSSLSEQKLEVAEMLKKVENRAPSYYGAKFTESTGISDVLSLSPNQFIVRVESESVKSPILPVTVYNVSITGVIAGSPANEGRIQITFFNGTVEEGCEYLVLLADARDSAPVYTLSSRNSVFTLENSKADVVLAEMLNKLEPFEAAGQDLSEVEILEKERAASGK